MQDFSCGEARFHPHIRFLSIFSAIAAFFLVLSSVCIPSADAGLASRSSGSGSWKIYRPSWVMGTAVDKAGKSGRFMARPNASTHYQPAFCVLPGYGAWGKANGKDPGGGKGRGGFPARPLNLSDYGNNSEYYRASIVALYYGPGGPGYNTATSKAIYPTTTPYGAMDEHWKEAFQHWLLSYYYLLGHNKSFVTPQRSVDWWYANVLDGRSANSMVHKIADLLSRSDLDALMKDDGGFTFAEYAPHAILLIGGGSLQDWVVSEAMPTVKIVKKTNEYALIGNADISTAKTWLNYGTDKIGWGTNRRYTFKPKKGAYLVNAVIDDKGVRRNFTTYETFSRVNDKEEPYYIFDFISTKVDGYIEVNGAPIRDTSVVLRAKKVVSGDKTNVEADKFTFGLFNSDGKRIQTAKADSSGNVKFTKIIYEGSKKVDGVDRVFNYTIKEIIPSKAVNNVYQGYTYDATVAKVKVVVSNNKATQTATVTYTKNKSNASPPVWTNKFKYTPVSVKLVATKALANHKLTQNQFSFTLKNSSNQTLQTKKNDSKGNIKFDALTFTTPGTYTYKVQEIKNSPANGVQFDTAIRNVKIVVTDSKGTLSAKTTYTDATGQSIKSLSFSNTYKANGSIQLKAYKVARYDEIAAGQFSFALSGNGVNLSASNKAPGDNGIAEVVFPKINYTQSDIGKTYTYTITENLGNDEQWDYDRHVAKVKVSIKDNHNGKLTCTATPVGGEQAITFINTKHAFGGVRLYKQNQDGVPLEGAVFAVFDEGGTEIMRCSSNADGIAASGPRDIPAGHYSIREIIAPAGCIPSNETRTFSIDRDNQIVDLSENPFINEQTSGQAQIVAFKVLSGAVLEDGEFSFELRDDSDSLVSSASCRADGNIAFPLITYASDDYGNTFHYTVREVSDGEARPWFEYDNAVFDVNVSIDDAGHVVVSYFDTAGNEVEGIPQFHNAYSASGQLVITGTKSFNGKALKGNDFTFVLEDAEGNEISTVKNDVDGLFSFQLDYTAADIGEHDYIVKERMEGFDGIVYDGQEYVVRVTVVDEGEGVLGVAISYPEGEVDNGEDVSGDPDDEGDPAGNGEDDVVDEDVPLPEDGNDDGDEGDEPGDGGDEVVQVDSPLSFTNDYEPVGEISLHAVKQYSGAPLTEDLFEFELRDDEGALVAMIGNDEDGNVVFPPIAYSTEDIGDHEYTITEIAGSNPQIDYDTHICHVRVHVLDIDDEADAGGHLECSSEYYRDADEEENPTSGEDEEPGDSPAEANVFSNIYTPMGGVRILKHDISGAPMPEVVFGIYSVATNRLVETIETDENGYAQTAPNALEAGSYYIVEISAPVGYATVEEKRVFDITADGMVDLSDNAIVNDRKTGVGYIKLTKRFIGASLLANAFVFQLFDEEGNLAATARNDANGNVVFALQFTADDIGKNHLYTVKEMDTGTPDVIYDDKMYYFGVSVTEQGRALSVSVVNIPSEGDEVDNEDAE